MKKFAAVLTGAALAGSVLTGCGGAASQSAASSAEASTPTDAGYRTVEEIQESGTINIGVFSELSPRSARRKLTSPCLT